MKKKEKILIKSKHYIIISDSNLNLVNLYYDPGLFCETADFETSDNYTSLKVRTPATDTKED